MLAKLSSLLLFVSFLLLFLVSLSIPIIKSVYLFRLSANEGSSLLHSSASGSVMFGVWGYCTSDTSLEVLGTDHTSAGSCSRAHLGYTFDSQVAHDLHVDGLTDAISATLSAALVLHVVDSILAFIAFVSSLFVRKWRAYSSGSAPHSQAWFLATILTAVFAAILTTISFIIDLVFVSVVSNKISDEANGILHVSRGNAVSMTIAAAVLIWVAIVLSSVDIFRGRRRAHRSPQMTEKGTSV